MSSYMIAEKFRSVQGEGVWTGTPMAFIRFVGCSVGKKVCHACDTDFERTHSFRGGGSFDPHSLLDWAEPYDHICLTGGEPLDQQLVPIVEEAPDSILFHIETSGTTPLGFLHEQIHRKRLWICVSPKPGYRSDMIELADEIKIIVPGLGSGEGWPGLPDALLWAKQKPDRVFFQPRNGKFDVDQQNLRYVLDCLAEHPQLRLSVQLHKVLHVQ